MNPNHLTDEQLDQLVVPVQQSEIPSVAHDSTLIGVAASQHLAACDVCQQEVDRLATTLCNLRGATTSWAASQAPAFDADSLLPRVTARPAALPVRRTVRLAWAGGIGTLALAAGLLLTFAHIPAFHLGDNTPNRQEAAANVQPGPTDEALLDGVETDLADSLPPTLTPLSVSNLSASTAH